MNKFTDLQKAEQIRYIDGLTLEYNLSTVAVEKDWWISAVLRALFALPYAENLSFKGGTSLSKCYNLIERFSEDIDIAVYAVVPERTFLEKICLLHEEFAKPQELIRTERMSRHLYDLVRMDDAGIAGKALSDKKLYQSIIEHRRMFIGLKGFDYDTLSPETINIIPPENALVQWQKDYETMRETMIYGESPPFDKLIEKIKQLNEKIRGIKIND